MSEVVGDTEEAVLETKRLEGQFIVYYGYPEWNKQPKQNCKEVTWGILLKVPHS